MSARRTFGRAGETMACDAYTRAGFVVVDRNFRCDLGELDVVARRGGLLVFCEVKSRSSDRWGDPSEAVDRRKQARLRRLAARWLSDRGIAASEVRFDVVSVVAGAGGTRVEVVEGAF